MHTLGSAGAILLLQAALFQAPATELPPAPVPIVAPGPPAPLKISTPLPPAPVPIVAPPPHFEKGSADDAPCWHLDWMIGLPTAARVQWQLNDDYRKAWFFEAFAGVEVIIPMVGAGVRRRFTCFDDGNLSFSVAPGVDAFLMSILLVNGVGVTTDIDFLFTKHTSSRGSYDFGFKLGASYVQTVGFWNDGSTAVLPVASFIICHRW